MKAPILAPPCPSPVAGGGTAVVPQPIASLRPMPPFQKQAPLKMLRNRVYEYFHARRPAQGAER